MPSKSERSTFVRKLDHGRYGYGYVERFKNFRKRPDIFITVGICLTVGAAEYARSQLKIENFPSTSRSSVNA